MAAGGPASFWVGVGGVGDVVPRCFPFLDCAGWCGAGWMVRWLLDLDAAVGERRGWRVSK